MFFCKNVSRSTVPHPDKGGSPLLSAVEEEMKPQKETTGGPTAVIHKVWKGTEATTPALPTILLRAKTFASLSPTAAIH